MLIQRPSDRVLTIPGDVLRVQTAVSVAAEAWDPTQATDDGGVTPDHWWRTDASVYEDTGLTTPAADDGDVAKGWDDVISGDQVIQATTSAAPTLKLNIQNGMPVLRFDGGDWLQGAFTNGGALSQPFTIFAVAQLNSGEVNDGVANMLLEGDDGTNRIILYKSEAPNPDGWGMHAGTALFGGSADANWNIWTALFNGGSSRFWHNGVSEASGNPGTKAPDGLTVGSTYAGTAPWVGDVGDIIIYPGNLSTADKNQVGQWLADRWGLTWTTIT